MQFFFHLFFIGVLIVGCFCLPEIERKKVEVKVSWGRMGRALHSPKHFNVNIKLDNNEERNLKLSPPTESVFSSSFRHIVHDVNENGEHELEEIQIDPISIEKYIFVDYKTEAFLHVKHLGDDKFLLKGLVGNLSLDYENDEHYVSIVPEHEQWKSVNFDPQHFPDYINTGDFENNKEDLSRQVVSYNPELAIAIDYANYQQFGAKDENVIQYLSIFFHGVNARYSTISDPKIKFQISGLYTFKSRAAQPFIENNPTPDKTGYDLGKVLTDFSKWVFTNRASLPKYDLMPLITGEDMQYLVDGTFGKSYSGLAYRPSRCPTDADRLLQLNGGQTIATSVSEDIGGFYRGLWTVIHELAHNLGSPHDGDGDSKSCNWSEGYIMSYEGYGKVNKFFFSPCTILTIKNNMKSTTGACYARKDATNYWKDSTQGIGQVQTLSKTCQMYTNKPDSFPKPNVPADDLCKNVICQWKETKDNKIYTWTMTTNSPAGDMAPCGTDNKGKCINGKCVV